MGQTRYYNLAFFDFGDELDSTLNVRKEIERFVMIDKQIYGLYNVFGNGVLNGWDVTDGGYTSDMGISINISPGNGIIKYMAAETSDVTRLHGLSSNSLLDIFATFEGSTPRTRRISFFDSSAGSEHDFAIRIAQVKTGFNTIEYIDNTVKDHVGFEQIIKDEINMHKHRGSPSKIDLANETKNQLPGARIDGLDASKIHSGRFDIDRIPQLDHNDLNNNGLLTHPALDTFVKTLSEANRELLGEVASINLLKTLIFLKTNYPDIDEQFVNEILLLPGISSDNYIDFEASTANINLEDNCISGKPIKKGLFSSVFWKDQHAFYNAHFKKNIVVSDGQVSLKRSGENIETVEDFEVGSKGLDVTFDKDISFDNKEIISISKGGDTNRIYGKYSGKFSANTDLIVTYTKHLYRTDAETGDTVGRDWSEDYDELVLYVKTTSSQHDPVFFYLINGDTMPGEEGFLEENKLGPFILLEENQATFNSDESMHNFEEIVINLKQLKIEENKNMDNITKLVIYTSEVSEDFSFLLDNIHVRRTDMFSSSGVIRLRHSSQSDIVYYSLFYDAVIPEGTNLRARVKVANSPSLLNRSSYTLPLSSGQVFALNGTDAEIEIIMKSDSSLTKTPVLDSVELRMMVDADFTGYELSETEDWDDGDFNNISKDSSNLVISDPINVGGYAFAYNDGISEIDDGIATEDKDSIAILGFNGGNMPISPNQAVLWDKKPMKRFEYLTSFIRKNNKNFIIADTRNNRLLEVSSKGDLIKGYGSSFISDNDLYPISAIYNPINHILSIVLTKPVEIDDISKIVLYIGSEKNPLDSSKDEIFNISKANGKILEIKLHEDTWTKLINVEDNLSINFEDGVFVETIKIGDNVQGLFGLYGMECFIGDFTYVDFIKHPIFVKILNNENWIFGNVSNNDLFYESKLDKEGGTYTVEEGTVPDIIEIDPSDGSVKYNSDVIKFSDFTLGGLIEYDTNRFLVAGIEEYTSDVSYDITGEDILEAAEVINRGTRIRASAVDSLEGYRGVVKIIDKNTDSYRNFYVSSHLLYPSDIDFAEYDNILLAESCFAEANGRLLQLDSFGNIIWSYGYGSFNRINSVKNLEDSLLVSL